MLTDEQKGAVQRHLKKVLASSEFSRSERAAAFLTFIVTHALNQDSETLKERIIGVAVFERPEDWDPKLDTTVRTEARRLRKKLSTYYASPAGEDQYVCIDVPLGAYIPKFRFVETTNHRLAESVATSDEPADSYRKRETDQGGLGTIFNASRVEPGSRLLSRQVLLICSLVVAPLLVALVILVHSRRMAASPPFQTIPLTTEYGNEISPTISPDSRQIAYVWDGGTGKYRIYIRSIKGGNSRRVTPGNSTELSPAFSPDGRQIAYLRMQPNDTEVVIRNLDDGTERPIGKIATQIGDWTGDPSPLIGNVGPTWTPDSHSLIVSDLASHLGAAGLVAINLTDGSRRQLTVTADSERDFLPKVSPDGSTLAFVRAVTHGISDVYLLDLKAMSLAKVTNESHSINGLSWGQDKGELIVSSNREGPYQLWMLDVTRPVLHKLDTDSANAIDPHLASSADWLAYVTTSQNWNVRQLAIGDQSSSSVERFIASSGRNHSAHYSPDGKHIAFVSDRSGTWEIWLCTTDCSEPQKITDFHGPWIGGLSWSPGSTKLAFDARLGRKSAIYTLSITNPIPEPLQKNNFEERMPSWSRDGKAIYFDSDRDGSVSIWKEDLGTGIVNKICLGFVARELNEDGRLLIGQQNGAIWKIARRGEVERPFADHILVDPILAWTTHGDILYYSYLGPDGQTHIVRSDGAHSQQVADLSARQPSTSASLDISPDGRSLLLTSIDQSSSNIYRRTGKLTFAK